MANIALQEGKVILKDGNVSCTCCGIVCPPISTFFSDIISQEMYNSIQSGGTYVANGMLHEGLGSPSCNLNKTEYGLISSGNCGFWLSLTESQNCNSIVGGGNIAYITFGCSISLVDGDYRFTYSGNAWCPYAFNGPNCYSMGYGISWEADHGYGFYPTKIGEITINTSAGILGPFGIWGFETLYSQGSLDITITPL